MDNAEYKLQSMTTTKLGRFDIVRGQVVRSGREYPYSYLHERDCVCVCPVTGQEVLLIRQYRYAVKDWCLELPCGAIEDGEQPEAAAVREVWEEAGCILEKITPLGDCYARAGVSDCRVYFYLAECSRIGEQKLDPTERIERFMVAQKELESMIRSGQFTQLMGIVCWLRAKECFAVHGKNRQWKGDGKLNVG